QQMARLDRAERAELDQRGTPGEAADGGRMLGEQRRLGARLVVLGLLADTLEDLAPLRVVEIAAVEPARMVGQPAHDRLRERIARLLERVDLELETVVGLPPKAGGGVRARHAQSAMWGPSLNQSPVRGAVAVRIALPT